MNAPIPLHGGWPILGAFPGLRRNVLKELEKAATKGDLVRLALPALPPVFLVTCPDGIRHVLQGAAENYGRSRFHDQLKPVMGEGLLTADGETWRRQRELLQPHFGASAVRRFVPAIATVVRSRSAAWSATGPAGTEIDVAEEMSALTLEIILRCMFGRADTDDISVAIRIAQSHIAARFWRVIEWPVWLPTPANRRFARAIASIDGAVDRILEGRRLADTRDDLLRSLQSVHGHAGCPAAHLPAAHLQAAHLSDRRLRDEIITILLAGHETSGVALAWALYLLARHPGAAGDIRAEVAATFGQGVPSADQVGALSRTRAVVNETMRLFPPAPWFARRARTADRLLGHPIPRDALVIVSPWLLHRDERWWSDPAAFDPGRFLGERNKARRPWAFIPFGGGPRSCIGLHLAMTEMVVALALIVRDFELSLADHQAPQPQAVITLRPLGALPIRFRPLRR